MKKYYDILGLPEGSSQEEIQKAYDKLSIDLDPKNNDNLDFFKEEFDLLNKAYSKLKDSTPKPDSKTDLKDKNTKEDKSPDDVAFGEDDSKSKKPKSKSKNKKLDKKQSKRYKKCPNNHFYNVELDDCPACLIEAKHLSNKEVDNSDKSEAPSSGDSDKNSKSKPKEPKPKEPKSKEPKPNKSKFSKYAIISFFSLLFIGFIAYIVDNNIRLEKANSYYNTALYNYKNKRYDTALRSLDRALAKKDDFVKAYSLKGDIYMKKENFSYATTNYRKARNINQNYDSINYKLGNSLISDNKIKSGKIFLQDFARELPSNRRVKEIDKIFENDNVSKTNKYLGVAYCNLLIKDSSVSSSDINDAYFNRGRLYIQLSEYQLAINDYNRYIKFDDDQPEAYNNRALAYYFSTTYDNSIFNKAILDFNKAIEIDSEDPGYYKRRGNTYYWMKNYLKAYEDYKKSLDYGYTLSDLNNTYYNKAKEEYDKEQAKIRRESWSYKKRARYKKLKIGQYYKGGIIFDLPSNYKVKILATTTTSKELTYYKARSKCDDLTLNGYSDWRIPSQSEIYKISDNYYTVNRGLRNSDVYYKSLNHTGFYWSSNYYGNDRTDFTKGYGYISYRLEKTDDGRYYFRGQKNDPKQLVRAVREHTFK